MEPFQLVVGMANLRKEISAIATSAAKLNERIHVCAVSCLAHVRDHGDWTPAALLCDALPKGQRVKALVYWFSHFSNGKLKLRETELGYRATLAKDRTAADFDVEGAMAVTFGDLTTERPPSVMTAESLLKVLARKASTREFDANGQRKATRASIALAASLKRLADELVKSPEFEALLSEERAEIEGAKILEAASSAETAQAA